jgi:hypothetical protein
MKITEFLQKAQYSRLTVGYRWLFADAYGYTVCERLPRKRKTKVLGSEFTEDEAVKLLIEGEELYSDLLEDILAVSGQSKQFICPNCETTHNETDCNGFCTASCLQEYEGK